MTPPRIQTWISHPGPKLEVFIPFLGKYHRPVSGRCCQTCTPRSWDGFYPEDLTALGFRDVSRVRETDTRFRGWLVRRVCGFLAAWEWKIPAETPGELLVRICSSRRVQDAASGQDPGSGGDEGSRRRRKEEVCRILGEIQAPLSPLLLRGRMRRTLKEFSDLPAWEFSHEQIQNPDEVGKYLEENFHNDYEKKKLILISWALAYAYRTLLDTVGQQIEAGEQGGKTAAKPDSEPKSAAKADSEPKTLAVAPAKKRTHRTDRPVDNDPGEGPSVPPNTKSEAQPTDTQSETEPTNTQSEAEPTDTQSETKQTDTKSEAQPTSRRSEATIESFSLKDLRGLRKDYTPLVLCHWLLPKLLTRLFLSVQLHCGQLEMLLRAARTPEVPLVFLCSHQSRVDGLLLSFILLSQGIGLPRVTVGTWPSPCLRSLLQRLGGIFLPSGMAQTLSDRDEGLPGAVLDAYIQEVLQSCQPLILFLEEPSASLQLADPARCWLLRVLRALRDGAVPDVLVVPVGIAYDVAPGRVEQDGVPPQPLGISTCLRAAFQALHWHRGCAQVDFSQPFSLREFVDNNLVGPVLTGNHPEQLLLPTILGRRPLDVGNVGTLSPSSGTEEEILVTALGLHALSDSSACSAITAVGITAALLLHRHQEVVLLPQLMWDFSALLEQLLLRGRAVGFSGQLRALVGHSLRQLQPPLAPRLLGPSKAALGPPEASARAWLGRLAGGVRHHLAGEAAGACAIRALLLEVLPILGPPSSLTRIVLSRDELLHKILELLQLLPPTLLGLQPCQPTQCHSLDILDKLILGGLLEEEEEPESERGACDVAPWHFLRRRSLGSFTDDSDSDSEQGVPKQCYKLSEPQGFPGFLLFLCRLLSPILHTYSRAVQFLERPPWPQPEADYVEALLEFLAEDEDGYPDRSLALSSLQSFKDMGVLDLLQTPTGPLLQLSQPFQSASNREKLGAFIHQFTQL